MIIIIIGHINEKTTILIIDLSDDEYQRFLKFIYNEGYVIIGHTYSFGNGGSDVYLIKTDNDGERVDSSFFFLTIFNKLLMEDILLLERQSLLISQSKWK